MPLFKYIAACARPGGIEGWALKSWVQEKSEFMTQMSFKMLLLRSNPPKIIALALEPGSRAHAWPKRAGGIVPALDICCQYGVGWE